MSAAGRNDMVCILLGDTYILCRTDVMRSQFLPLALLQRADGGRDHDVATVTVTCCWLKEDVGGEGIKWFFK